MNAELEEAAHRVTVEELDKERFHFRLREIEIRLVEIQRDLTKLIVHFGLKLGA